MDFYRNRIKELMKAKDIKSFRELAELIGVNEYTLGRQIKGDRSVSLDVIDAIIKAIPDVSAEWLMRGEGPIFKADIKTVEPEPKMSYLDFFLTGLSKQSIEHLDEMSNIFTSYYRLRKESKGE